MLDTPGWRTICSFSPFPTVLLQAVSWPVAQRRAPALRTAFWMWTWRNSRAALPRVPSFASRTPSTAAFRCCRTVTRRDSRRPPATWAAPASRLLARTAMAARSATTWPCWWRTPSPRAEATIYDAEGGLRRRLQIDPCAEQEVTPSMAVQHATVGIDVGSGVGGRVQEVERFEAQLEVLVHGVARGQVEPRVRFRIVPEVAIRRGPALQIVTAVGERQADPELRIFIVHRRVDGVVGQVRQAFLDGVAIEGVVHQ